MSGGMTPERLAEIVAGRTEYRTSEQLDAAIDDLLAERDRLAAELARARERVAELEDRDERRRVRLVRAEGDLLDIRGALAPAGRPRRVPMELGERVAPAVEWLLAELDRARREARQWLAEPRPEPASAVPLPWLAQTIEQGSLPEFLADLAAAAIGYYRPEASAEHTLAEVRRVLACWQADADTSAPDPEAGEGRG